MSHLIPKCENKKSESSHPCLAQWDKTISKVVQFADFILGGCWGGRKYTDKQ